MPSRQWNRFIRLGTISSQTVVLLTSRAGLPFEIEVADEFTYAEKGSTVVLPCVINDDDADPFDKGAEAVTWTKYLPKVRCELRPI